MQTTPNHTQTSEFVTLLTNHQSDLWAFIISLIPGSPDVSDILQKTNLTIWSKQNDFQHGSDFRAWALAIARYEVLAHLKKAKRSNWLVFSDELIDTIATEAPKAIPPSSKRLELLETCMAKLKPNHLDLLKHRYQSNQGLETYAAASKRSVSSLSVTLHRIRATLKKCIQSGLDEPQQAGGES